MQPSVLVRVRFAPSPTGQLHVGGLRTALFNWLFARHHGGKFILRLEDTDRERHQPDSVAAIYAALDWLGITPDEGPQQGGPYAPYIQSQRLELYREAAASLIVKAQAYRCYCTPEKLAATRTQQQTQKQAPHYDRHCRDLSAEERLAHEKTSQPFVVRLRVPDSGTISVNDSVRGRVEFSLGTIDDAVLLKSDGFPTYHLANVVDDHAMRITHVIRAEEWISSLPKHLLLYQALTWDAPQFAHIPLILGQDRTKLSKRHGHTSVQRYREHGYLPEALLNYLALLGWNPGTEQELFTSEELIAAFDLDRVQPSGAIFDQTKLDWINLQYLKRLTVEQLKALVKPWLPTAADNPPEWWDVLLVAIRDRFKRLDELPQLLSFLGALPEYETSLLIPPKYSSEKIQQVLMAVQQAAEQRTGEWTLDAVRLLLETVVSTIQDTKAVLWPVRVAITGQKASPPVFESAYVVGEEAFRQRLDFALKKLDALPKG